MFPYLRLLHLADLHLGYAPKDLSGREAERAKERDSILERAVTFALDPKNDVDLVVISGDLFDSHEPAQDLVERNMGLLARLVRSGVALITTPGNHDEVTYAGSVFRIRASRWPGILVQNPMPEKVESINIKGVPVHVYSLAYTGGITRTSPAVNEFPHTRQPGIHLAVFHGSYGPLAPGKKDRSLPLDDKALEASGYDYVALGHVHSFQEYDVPKAGATDGSRTKIVYAGAIEGKGFDDPGTGHFVLVDIRPGTTAVLQKVDIGTRKYCTENIDISGMAADVELDRAFESLAQKHSNDIVRVVITGRSGFAADAAGLAARWKHRFYHVEVLGDAPAFAEWEIDTWGTEPTIRGEFIRRVRQRLEKTRDPEEKDTLERALYEGLYALMRGGGL